MSSIKVVNLIQQQTRFSYSCEITPDANLDEAIKLSGFSIFYSVTWHAKSHQCLDLDIGPLKAANYLIRKQKPVLLHLSCDLLKKSYLDSVLDLLISRGICNLLIILGEKYEPGTSDFKKSLDLIKYIREKTGDYFCIGIPGFPDCDSVKLQEMKEKVDNGANFIITQAFFDVDVYKEFIKRCEDIGISVPIIPGIFPFETYTQLTNFSTMCKVKVPKSLLELVKNNDNNNKPNNGVIEDLMSSLISSSKHIHLFSLKNKKTITN